MSPPRLADRLLTWFCAPHLREEVLGDLHERYALRVKHGGQTRARRRYWRDVLAYVRPEFIKRHPSEYPQPTNTIMLRNYLKIAWRNVLRYKLNSALTITGLALGLACGLLMILHVREELNYDKGFSKADRIYRITSENIGEKNRQWAATSPILGGEMQQAIPAIQTVARFHRPYPDRIFSYVPANGVTKQFEEKSGFFADSTVVDVFDLSFVKGDPQTALKHQDAIVLTEAMAAKYFGNENPLGKRIQDDLDKRLLTVTGVIKPYSFPTHLQFDYLISMSTFYSYTDRNTLENRGWSGFYNYILLNSSVSRSDVEKRIPAFMVKFYEAKGETRKEILATRRTPIQPITDIHLHSKLEKEMGPNSDITYVYVFSIAALFILLLAAVNFINMATAQAFNRMKEVGVRKVLGARKNQLIRQFLGESFILTLVATMGAFLLFRLAIPFYNDLAAKTLRFEQLFTASNGVLLALLIGLISLVAGFYPALFIANFTPVNSLKGKKSQVSSVTLVRKGLIVFQFSVSVFMIFSTIVVYRQMKFFQTKDLGFDQDQVVAIKLYGREMWDKADVIQQEFQKNSAITNVARISTLPGDRFGTDMLTLPGKSEDANQFRFMWADENTLPVLQIRMKAGRNFVRKMENAHFPLILNEAAARALKLDSPIGQKAVSLGDTGEIVGIVSDFHFASLHNTVDPLVIVQHPGQANYFLLKISGNKLTETLQFAQSTLARLSPGSLFSYTFLDEKMARLYDSEKRVGNVLNVFAVFAMFISCMGLFGLTAYAAQVRTKEVGVRKVLGATVTGIIALLSRDFLRLVLIATILASPVAWWAMHIWLNDFAYHIDIEWWMFGISSLLALVIALLTVSYQSIKAALMNPVKSLRSE
ncbi:permease prefix domain 2-containing transporter [Spirosoma sp. SC4-14]|uniref:permease prefix domain 2-containing transporter n=1 Tax=Spirosoma sp. SC4-14 TaxID=3128900 RepID=UPI0030CE0BF4